MEGHSSGLDCSCLAILSLFQSSIWSLVMADHCCSLPCSPLLALWCLCHTHATLGVWRARWYTAPSLLWAWGTLLSCPRWVALIMFCCPWITPELRKTLRNCGAIFCIDIPHHTKLGPGDYFYFLRKKSVFVRVKSKPLEKDTYSPVIFRFCVTICGPV